MNEEFDPNSLFLQDDEEEKEQGIFDPNSLFVQDEVPTPVVAEEPQPVVEEPTEVPVPAELTPPKPKTYDTPEEQQTDDMLSFQPNQKHMTHQKSNRQMTCCRSKSLLLMVTTWLC